MKTWIPVVMVTTAIWICGCSSQQWPTERRSSMNTWSVNEYHRDSERAAILSAHTLYPYHFIDNSANLNELGERDLLVLADFYRDNPGSLNVRQMDTPSKLYHARLDTVTAMLTAAGVDGERVRIKDRHSGGQGISSTRMIVILEEKMDKPLELEETGLSTISGSNK